MTFFVIGPRRRLQEVLLQRITQTSYHKDNDIKNNGGNNFFTFD
jgi:hypothetical protein